MIDFFQLVLRLLSAMTLFHIVCVNHCLRFVDDFSEVPFF